MLNITKVNGNTIKYPAWEKLCIFNTPEVVKVNKLIQVSIGQGEGDTRWKGCPWKLLLSIFNTGLFTPCEPEKSYYPF